MSTIIIATILIAITTAVPLVFIWVSRKKARKQNEENLKAFKKAGSNNGLSFAHYEVLKNKIIGLDTLNKSLLVFELNKANVAVIDMKIATSCSIYKEYESIDIGSDKKATIERHLRSIDLKFILKGSVEPVLISIYNSNVNSIYEMAELETKAKDWHAVLSAMLVKELKAIA